MPEDERWLYKASWSFHTAMTSSGMEMSCAGWRPAGWDGGEFLYTCLEASDFELNQQLVSWLSMLLTGGSRGKGALPNSFILPGQEAFSGSDVVVILLGSFQGVDIWSA